MKVAFFDSKPYDKKYFNAEIQNKNIEIKYFKDRLTEESVKLAEGYDAVCVFVKDDVNENVINTLHKYGIRLIALRCAGYNNVHLKTAYKRIHTVRVPAYSPYAVAEHAAALALTLNRKTHRAYFRTRDSNFNIDGLMGFDMHGKTAGVIGTGKIGQILIKILTGFGMKVIASDPFPDEKIAEKLGFEYADMDRLFRTSDLISLHCPLTAETRHLINKNTIEKMKDHVMIINTSRGLLINTADLIAALKTGKIGAAGLDVYEEEDEYFFEDFSGTFLTDDVLARLLSFNNVLITSHQAFFTNEAMTNISGTTVSNIIDYFEKDELPNEVCYFCDVKPCPKKNGGKCF
ncbi:MAG: 2-hydroxyacid dehydrogenase [Spirochaetes bacterium]|nr:2-hydroxyacid dehydrogenase [Spirochaetota bacterium]